MSNTVQKRLMRDYRDISKDTELHQYFSLQPDKIKDINEEGDVIDIENMFHWKGFINGPSGTPYEGGRFDVDITIPNNYPYSPPSMKFITPIYHPNIKQGMICLNILKSPPGGDWAASLTLGQVMLSVHELLSDPNPSDPLNAEAANLYKKDREAYIVQATLWKNKYALRHLKK
jgi:ubiquitin-conjugating enzyme (huntingtin interacting protein 2)